MGTGIPLNKANTNSNSTSNVKERQLKFRKVKSGKFRLYFQIKGNENYNTVCLDEDKKPVTKSKSSYKELLKQKKYPLDLGATDYWVPIAIGESKKVNKTLNSADIKLTPVFPLSFSEEKGTRLAHLRSGYLYIFMDGFLWREIQVNKKDPKSGKFIDDWKFYDVNLTLHQGKDERKAIDGVSSQLGAIVIPYKIGKKNPKIEVCFSHVQWSWDYICKMGGMDKDYDPRYIKELQSKYKNVKPVDAIKQSRLQLIKLHEYNITKKSPDDIRSKYLMPLKQAYSENKYVSPPPREIPDKSPKKTYVTEYFTNIESHKKNFRPGRAFLEHLHPPKEPAFLNDLLNPPKKMSSKRKALRDIYIESELPALILIDPIDVADTLRFRFKYAVNALVDFEDHIQKEDAIGQYVVQLVKDDEDLEEHLRKGETGETIKKKLEEFKAERKLITKKADDRANILIKFLNKGTLSEKKSNINTLAAAFKDYEVLEAYSEKRKRKQAAQAVELWDLYTDHLEMFQSGVNFIHNEGSTRQTTTSKMIAVGFNRQIRAEIKKEKDKIKTLFRSKNVQIISKVPKTDPHSKEDPWHTSKRLFGLTKKFWIILGRLVRKVTKRWNQIFLTSGQFPWKDFPKLIEKIYGLNLKIKDYSISQFKEIMFKSTLTAKNDEEFNRITRMEKAPCVRLVVASIET
ncbi:hypothetical protein MNBD_GAMMA12-2564 [hydrothermal vent metagenome]|uniref:Uncharacterized protein n=1 Tax=hydrothermal vent metagenome TaxID=652676 RepID=A0A3B0YLF9_9ZZZZ